MAPILSTFAVTPFVVRALGTEQYGVVGIGITLYQVGLVIFSLGLAGAITRHAIVGRSGAAGASGLVLVGAAAALLLGGIAAAASPWWAPLMVAGQSPGVLVAPVASAVGLATVMLAQSFLRGVDRVRLFVAIGMMAAIIPPLTGLISISSGTPVAAGYLWPLAGAHCFVGLFALAVVLFIARPAISTREFWESLWIGLPTVPHQMATSSLTAVLVVSAGALSGVSTAGVLQLALLLGTAPMVVIGAFNNAWAPLIYRAGDKERNGVLTESTWLVAVLSLVLVTGFACVAPLLALVVGGSESESIVPPALVAAAGGPLMVLYLSNIHLVFLRGRTWPLAWTTPASLVVTIACVLLVVQMTGSDDLRILALAVPTFYALQSFAATMLARGTGYGLPRLGGSAGFLAAGCLACLLLGVFSPPPLAGIVVFACALLTAMLSAVWWRNRKTGDA